MYSIPNLAWRSARHPRYYIPHINIGKMLLHSSEVWASSRPVHVFSSHYFLCLDYSRSDSTLSENPAYSEHNPSTMDAHILQLRISFYSEFTSRKSTHQVPLKVVVIFELIGNTRWKIGLLNKATGHGPFFGVPRILVYAFLKQKNGHNIHRKQSILYEKSRNETGRECQY